MTGTVLTPPVGADAVAAGAPTARPLRVVLAASDAATRGWWRVAVEGAGHRVLGEAADVDAALAALARVEAQLVVFPLADPALDALALCRRQRAVEAARPEEPACYLLTTMESLEPDPMPILAAGADDFVLAEPRAPHRLVARLAVAERRLAQADARRRAEAALARARWLAGIGETSIALQHEINNPLAALLGHAALIEHGLVDPHEEREILGVIVEQAQRIAAVVKRLARLRDPQSVEYVGGARMLDLSRDVAAGGAPGASGDGARADGVRSGDAVGDDAAVKDVARG